MPGARLDDTARGTDLSDSPTAPGRSRGPRRDLLPPFESDTGRRPLNGRPAVRPVDARPPRPVDARSPRPIDARPPRPEGRPARRGDEEIVVRGRPAVPPLAAGGPRTSMAPFLAVPAPEAQPDKYSPESLAAGRRRTDREPRRDAEAPSQADARSEATSSPSPRSSIPPVPPRQAGPQPPAADYGDWTKPSKDHDDRRRPLRAPETSLIPERVPERMPERKPAGCGGSRPDSAELELDRSERTRTSDGPERSPASDPSLTSTRVVGGRAALRAQRQAADAERRKVAARQPETGREKTAAAPSGRGKRIGMAVVAVAVVALGVLGVYSFTSPKTTQAAHTTTKSSPAPTDAAAPAAQSLPPLDTGTQSSGPAPAAAPVKVPITVLNATTVTGLAAKLSSTFGGGGWQTTGVGAYKGTDVAATTVYFTQGDETQRQAAVALVTQFPKLSGPVPRFFDVPGNPTPGLVVVAAGDWKP